MGEPSLLKSALAGASANGAASSQQPLMAASQRSSLGNFRPLSLTQPLTNQNLSVKTPVSVECKGWLYKWTNYIKGYKKRWFVLENGYLSYYRNQTEVAHTCRGTINVMTATIQQDDPLVIILQNGATNVFHLKAANEVERQRWLSKLQLAKSHSAQVRSSVHAAVVRSSGLSQGTVADADEDDDADENDSYNNERVERAGPEFEKQTVILSSKIDDLRTCFALVNKHHADVMRLIDQTAPSTPTSIPRASVQAAKQSGLGDRFAVASASSGALHEQCANVRDKELLEKLQLFKISSRAMLNACQEYYDTAMQQGRRWQRLLEREHEQRVQFEGVVEHLARQQRNLEKQAIREIKSARVSVSTLPKSQNQSQSKPTASSRADSRVQSASSNGAAAGGNATVSPAARANPTQSVGATDSEDDDDYSNDDFYDALDIEAPSVISKSYFPLAHNNAPSTPSSTAVKLSPSFDTLSTASSQDSAANLQLGGKAAIAGTPQTVKSGSKSSVHHRSQSDWTSGQQARADAAITTGTVPSESPQRSQSKQSLSAADHTEQTAEDEDKQPIQLVPVPRDGPFVPSAPLAKPRRSAIPFKPASSLNLWSIIKNCVGRELSKIPFPVNFSEPISMLQRLVEDLEYSALLDRAADCSDPIEQMALVAVFNISSYATTSNRTTKPFNPVLGETYEWDRSGEPEFGWRMIAEQVSHHPPAAAFHCESAKWTCFEEFTLGSKFRGMYLQVQPLGEAHCEFKRDRNHYTWTRVATVVNNIIIGKLWIDNIGECVVVNHTLGIRCYLKFVQHSFFQSEIHRVVGVVKDRNGEARYILSGTWDEKMEGAWLKRPPANSRNPYANLEPEGVAKIWQSLKPADKQLLWRRNEYPPNSEKMYNFTHFALQLNEEEPGVAPTDSRMRPDQRLMEQGLWDAANVEKLRVEEKQRASRRAIERMNEQRVLKGQPAIEHEPTWFRRQRDNYTGQNIFKYAGEYWDCKRRGDWSRSQNLF